MVRGAHGYGGPGPCRKVSALEHEAKQWWLGVLALSEGEPLACPPESFTASMGNHSASWGTVEALT